MRKGEVTSEGERRKVGAGRHLRRPENGPFFTNNKESSAFSTTHFSSLECESYFTGGASGRLSAGFLLSLRRQPPIQPPPLVEAVVAGARTARRDKAGERKNAHAHAHAHSHSPTHTHSYAHNHMDTYTHTHKHMERVRERERKTKRVRKITMMRDR